MYLSSMTLLPLLTLLAPLASPASPASLKPRSPLSKRTDPTSLSRTPNPAWAVSNFANLIVFGDSYSDESRLSYFIAHNGSAPPPGLLLPEGLSTASGGRTWPRFVVQYTGETVGGRWTPQLELYDYAVSGAVCSNLITPRFFSTINANFPSVLEYEIPAFKTDSQTTRNGTNQPFFTTARDASNSVYTIWIGTNDLGVDAFVTASEVPGKVLTDYTNCVYQAFDELYASGGRNFVLMNTLPLQLSPLYANDTLHGTSASNSTCWPDKPANHTEIAELMHQFTTSVNNIYKYQTPFEQLVATRYPGSSWALFDVWSLISDIYDNPSQCLNGTEPAGVEGAEHVCNGNGTICTYAYNRTSSDSFLWYDSLHPSVQTDRIIARNFVEVLNGTSKYATCY